MGIMRRAYLRMQLNVIKVPPLCGGTVKWS
jgi:hypothetical protein